ncbi:precorrin-3B synthase [Paracoccus zhejiangensis]|uniref:Precorrin-3B synthase n=1 Tax=Paracoccus zhejiangensis TaxID=1077935 RepID=A0A2H5F4X2_9RHOB|nr:precorrin-3B synthase [Paracoccus zhejiangensis]AUH66585.1 precorrin-3B synthase [Paracoccus zhejiangensis]
MSGFQVQGWCPGALRPMLSGDGLVVRLRPRLGRLNRAQAEGLAAAAVKHGNGLMDLTARGNLQLRGVREENHAPLIAELQALGLVDADLQTEARRNLLVTHFADAETEALALAVTGALAAGPDLPGKFGFVIDSGPAPVLSATAGDIRLERDETGGLILRADGAERGAPVSEGDAPEAAVALARWFLAAGGVRDGRGRMAALIARGIHPEGTLTGTTRPAPALPPPGPGLAPQGALVALEFGQVGAGTLAALAILGPLRLTPWRMLLIEGVHHLPDLPGLILTPNDPRLRVTACTGAPGCRQGHRPVRHLARALAADVPPGRVLHVSGCAKGCAHPGVADLTLIATAAGFDLVRNGRAQDKAGQQLPADGPIDLKGLF